MNHLAKPDPLERARLLGPAIDDAADEIERTRRLPEPLLSQMHEARMFRLLLPRSAGGEEVDPGVYLRAVEQISRHDGSLGWNMFVGNSSSLIAAYLPEATARNIWGDPRTIVAWGPPNASRARAVPGGYRVSGRWDFASGCRTATWMGAHCMVEEPDGSLRKNHTGRPAVRSLLYPVAQATLLDTWHTIGMRGTASDSYELHDVFVPEAYSGTREDPTENREPGPLYVFTQQGLYAVGVVGVALGIAGAMHSAFIELARDKTPRGLARLADNAVIQAKVAQAEAKLESARAWVLDVLASIYARADGAIPSRLADRARVRLACANAIQAASDVADMTYKEAGVSAIFPGTPFERRFRDIHTLTQQIQSRGSHYEAVGSILLGNEPAGPFY
ncbi:MAG: acyl-CoA dehydrogenase [Acetobacteraceae bacterium]|nr:acyl-CoA dehydrogenase [Acetobacteraceae bacterium]